MKSVKKVDKFEKNYFEGWYKHYVGTFSQEDMDNQKKWFWAWLKKLEQYIPLSNSSNKSVLEVGCSIGAVANLLVEKGYKVYASDISRYAVTRAKKLTPTAHFSVIDIQKPIPLKQKFDLLISFEVVEHLENPEIAIKHMYNAIKGKGKIVISTPYPYQWNYRDKTHISMKYPEEWVSIMKKTGFKKISYHRFSLLPFFYKFNKHLQIIIPFAIPLPYINSPIFFIGEK